VFCAVFFACNLALTAYLASRPRRSCRKVRWRLIPGIF
jgi:hypothetical protein